MPEIESVRSAGVEGIERTSRSVTRSSSPAEKIKLFRSLFRGRMDVYAQRFESRNGWGRMEVDLLCSEARLVVEIDGSQHLGDAEAYRRDRRKDALLQQNGYLVLRFLAEDVGKRLDEVLDRILAGLQNRQARCE